MNRKELLLDLYGFMLASRESDLVEIELVNSGEANFLASSGGHEGSVIFAPLLQKTDWLHCHYRDKALMLARGISNQMFFYSALAKQESHSAGRQMVSHMSARELNVLSLVGPVGNNALQAVGVALSIKEQADCPIVLCSIGDGTSQQGEVLEAIAEAKRSSAPVLFLIHNNELAISTRTRGKTFFSLPDNNYPDSFYGVPITHIDGVDAFSQYDKVASIVKNMREDRAPHIVIFNVDRLDNHSNADDQKLYRSNLELQKNRDPLIFAAQFLVANGVSEEELIKLRQDVVHNVRLELEAARLGHEPQAVFGAEKELPNELLALAKEYRGDVLATERLTMLEAMREVFDYQLANNENVYLLGEDIEDGKGDVFGVTKGLSTKYPGRVKNSALSESTIAGVACGMALTGKHPVAFLQFADFMPLAFNQICSEIATMYWRSNGLWQSPVILFAACGGYKPGLGPFHSQTNEATYAHIPGIDVYMPSNAADAAGMLNAAFKSMRPSVFLYPKKLLNAASDLATTSYDIDKHLIPVGKARIAKVGEDITLLGWGNTLELCMQVAETLEQADVNAEVIDLRTIKPYDLDTILVSVEKTKNLIVVHEDNVTCGVGGEIIAAIVERASCAIKVRRVAKSDTYVPCNFANQLEVLPSYERVLTNAAELLNLDLTWKIEVLKDESLYQVEVIGASPSDESVLISSILVRVGDEINSGDVLVDIEASKASGEILAPCAGVIEEICVKVDERALVGSTLLKIRLASGVVKANKQSKPEAVLMRRKVISKSTDNVNLVTQGLNSVGIGQSFYKTGSKKVANKDILVDFVGYTSEDIIQRTGIESRYWLDKNESIVDIAAAIAHEALIANNLKLSNIDKIICATCTTEKYQSPSMGCLILNKLYDIYGEQHIAAYDINAACSGFVFALQNAKDYLQSRPNERVLLITAENLTSRVNKDDFATVFLFADAASATIISGANHLSESKATIDEVYLTSVAEDGAILNIPNQKFLGIHLSGNKVFPLAVKTMTGVLRKCCQLADITLDDLNLIVPHQANQRISNAIEQRVGLPQGVMFSNIAEFGNTSSSTIPIGLAQSLMSRKVGEKIALCAFGGGFTAGAAVLSIIKD